jgi:predicted KAP-like P-loop ATPase
MSQLWSIQKMAKCGDEMNNFDPELLEAKKEAVRLCGTANLIEAFSQIEAEREAMLILHDKNQALIIHIHKLDEILRVTNTIVTGIIKNGVMFLEPNTRAAISKYQILYQQIEKRLQEALSL